MDVISDAARCFCSCWQICCFHLPDDDRLRSTRFFQDGKRKIDFVMAYEDSGDDPKNENRRRTFESGLVQKGLELETEPKETSQNEKTCFVKIHVPYATRLVYAERMKMKMPLKVEKSSEDEDDDSDSCKCNWYSQLEEFLTQPFVLENENLRHKEDDDNYTAEFRADRIEFFDVEDEETFFGECDRSRIAYRIMCETQFEEERASVGINQLINLGGYSNVFPLHDMDITQVYKNKIEQAQPDFNDQQYEGQHQVDKKDENSMVINAADTNMRRILYEEWARWGRWYKFQPLDAIRSYLGDKLALYFAWLGFYTEMLIYPTIVGFICFIYSIISMGSHAPTLEVCDANYATYAGDEPMCPLCDRECSYWNLTSSCLASQITYVFDNESTIFFAIFMSVWATMFLEFWKRRQFKLNYKWDLVDYDEARDLIRPEFEAQVTRERINPVTRQREPYLSDTERCQRMCLSAVTVFFWVIVVIAAVIAVIIYRITISAVFAVSIDYEALGTIGTIATPALLTTVTGSIISLVIIMGLNVVYEKIAMALTNIELPRTQTEFEDSFTFKMFCFQFVNYYSYLFYIAFLKQALAGHPNKYNYFAGRYRWEECDAGGCMYELSLQLIIIMVGKQIWNNMIELLLPWAMNKYRQWKSTKASIDAPGNRYTRWEQDYDLTPFLPLELFYEYLEMVIQFGFVTLFVVAFPLAPVLALLNNIVEIRLDANKIICEYRRPVSHKCSDIGVWYYLLDFIGTLAVVTNAFTIAFTSETIPKIVYYWSYSIENGNSERTYRGYTNNSLSVFAVSDFTALSRPMTNEYNTTYCRYKDYRAPPGGEDAYQLTTQYWNVMAGRLVFVIVMEHLVIFLKRFLDYLIPDRPQGLRCQIKREHYLVQQLLVRAEADHLVRQSNQESTLHGRDEPTLEQSESANAQADALDNLKEFEEASGTAAARLKFKFNFNFNSNLTFKPTPTTMTTEEEKEPDDGGEKADESQDNGVAS